MLRRLLRLTLRTLRRRLSYALISGVGLTVALTCAGLVGSYLWFETTYDTFHEDAEDIGRIYRVAKENPDERPSPRMQGLVGRQLKERVAGIEHVTALHNLYRTLRLRKAQQTPGSEPTGPDTGLEIPVREGFFVPAGDAFLDVFSGFEVIRGDAATALSAPGEALIPRSTAERLFGTVDVIGRTVTLDLRTSDTPVYDSDGRTETLTIRAVTEDVPARSHFSYQLVYSVPPTSLSRYWSGAYTYFELAPEANKDAILQEAMPTWDGIVEDGGFTEKDGGWAENYNAVFEPLLDIHLYTMVDRPLGQPTDARYLWALGLLALVIVGVAGANYANLAAAMYADRSREVGARRAIGAQSGQVARQFIGESVVLALLCVPLALGLASALTPAFNQLMSTQLPLPALAPLTWLGTALGATLLGAVAGLYPAMGVARRPVPSLFKGSAFGSSGSALRRGLVVMQFALFIGLGCSAVLMQQQMTFLQEKDLGFRPSGLVEITNGRALTASADPNRNYLDRRTVSQSKAFQQELQQSPLVRATGAGRNILDEQPGDVEFRRAGASSAQSFESTWSVMTPNMPELLDLKPKAGAYFDRPLPERRDSVAIVNPQALDKLGCDVRNLADCRIDTGWDDWLGVMPVVGVFEDARFSSLRYGSRPIVLFLNNQEAIRGAAGQDVYVRFRDGVPRTEQTRLIESTWQQFVADRPAEYEVFTERIDAFYVQDRRLRTLGLGLTGVAMALVVLGLLAITAYLTRLRLKEVAIRKALGATMTSILALLNREFVGLVGVAFVLGSALSYLAVSEWLSGFATRIDVSPLVFLAVGTGALMLSVAAVSAQSLSAARVDPARVLRSE
jgi:putative ABC transport system permease protein